MVHHQRTLSHDRLLKGDIEQQLLLTMPTPSPPPPSVPLPHPPQTKRHLLAASSAPESEGKLAHWRFYPLVVILGLVSLSLVATPLFLLNGYSSASSSAQAAAAGKERYGAVGDNKFVLPCSDVANNTICCDRTSNFRTDVCVMRGDVRTRPAVSSLFLYNAVLPTTNKKHNHGSAASTLVEKVRPYTRKWETSVMETINELDLVATTEHSTSSAHKCDVTHDVPAVVFSTGGYTGNVYHEFNDGILPLFITAQKYNKNVIFVAVEYHAWWATKYADVLGQMTDYPVMDFFADNRTHCFPEVTVGMRIHDELTVDAERMMSKATILDFRKMLDNAYRPRIQHLQQEEEQQQAAASQQTTPTTPSTDDDQAPEPTIIERPKLVIFSRNGSRGIDNEDGLVALCEEIGFTVRVLRPDRTTELAKIYRVLNDSDAMIGVHGAAMTHLLFMRPGAVFIQIVPLGTDWAAENYYGAPARKMGLKYVGYRVMPKESSLYDKYPRDSPVLRDPNAVAAKGWQVTKEVYLDGQSVRLDLNRFLKRLARAYHYTSTKKNRLDVTWDWSWQLPPQSQPKAAAAAAATRKLRR